MRHVGHQHNRMGTMTTKTTWIDRLRAAAQAFANPAAEHNPAPEPTDEEIRAAWEPITWRGGVGHINPLLDLPLKDYGGMGKARLWEMFVGKLADHECGWILRDEERQAEPPKPFGRMDPATLQPLTQEEADAQHAARLAVWKANREPALRPGDPAAAVSVWLWHNGLHEQAVDVFATIWMAVRAEQDRRDRIGWSADDALRGFRVAAYRDWDDDDQKQFEALFRQRYVDPEIDTGLHELTGKS